MEKQKILKKCTLYKYEGPSILESGNTKLFKINVLGLDPERKSNE